MAIKQQDGAPQSSSREPLVYKWLNSMVYGRYNELVHGDYFIVYNINQPINGRPHPVSNRLWAFFFAHVGSMLSPCWLCVGHMFSHDGHVGTILNFGPC